MGRERMVKVKKEDKQFPFSEGILAKSVAGAGLPVSEAYKVAHQIHEELENREVPAVAVDEIRKRVSAKLVHWGWENEERFYRVRRHIKYLEKPLFILVGGATGVGKSSVAAELGHRLGINRVIGTDTIREIMRSIISHNLIPTLHESSFEAEESTNMPSFEREFIFAFEEQARVVMEGVTAVMRRAVKEGLHMVLNGVHIVPGFLLERMPSPPHHMFQYVLSVPDQKQHTMFFYEREKGTRRAPHRYVKKIDRIRQLQQYISDAAEKSDIPVIENVEFEKTLRLILEDVIAGLSQEVSI